MKAGTIVEAPLFGNQTFERILVAFDGSEVAFRALAVATRLARRLAAQIVILKVIARPTYLYAMGPTSQGLAVPRNLPEIQERDLRIAERSLDGVVSATKSLGVNATGRVTQTHFPVGMEIAKEAAAEKADLVVVGRRRMSWIKRLFTGSVSGGVAEHAGCPVLVVK